MMMVVIKYETKHRKQYSGLLGVGYISIVILFLSFSILISVHDIQALTRGTPYDDVLSGKSINSNNSKINSSQTNLMSTSETYDENETGTNGQQNVTSEFIYGDYGNDEIEGSAVGDHLSGGPGHDVINGHDGGDYLQGGPGNDTLSGDKGNDAFNGGEGADYFDCGNGRDSVDDFDSSTGDIALNNCEVLENEEAPFH